MPSADRPTIAIVTALEEELKSILPHARDVRRRAGGFFEGRFGSARLVLAATGDGAMSAGRHAGELCDAIGPAALVGAGVAGALSRELNVGDLVVGTTVRDAQGDAPQPDARLLAWALASGARAATLLTVREPVVSPQAKAALVTSLSADTVAAVDMESAAWARAAGSRRIPSLMVRSISDRADEHLPEYLARCLDENGQIRRAAVVGFGIARPATIPSLLRMRQRMTLCGERLGRFLERLLGEAP